MTCVLFLIDESTALSARVAEGTKSKADCLATAVNALLSQLTAGPGADLALVGYRRADDGTQDVGCRWGGPLEGRQWVGTAELEASPRAVEDRVRKTPGPGGYGVTREETVRFPIWYVPVLKAPGSRRSALDACLKLLAQRAAAAPAAPEAPEENAQGTSTAGSVPPLVLHLLAELSDEDGFEAVGEVFSESHRWGATPLVLHAHLGSSSRVPPTVYPSSDTNLSPPLLRHAFRASSVLPGPLAAHLRAQGAALNRGARGLIYNARMVDLIRLLSLVKAYVAWASQPPPSAAEPAKPVAATAPASETTCSQAESPGASSSPALAQATSLVVFVLDRSCATPDASAAEPNSAWRRLQDRANDLIGQLARKTSGRIEIAIVAYGRDPSGAVEVQTGFAGATAGRAWIGPGEIAEGAIRVEEITEQVSDGVGGLLKIARKRPVLLDLKPTAPAAPEAALARVAEMLAQWTESHPGQRAEPIVVHCTRGQFEPDAVRQSVDRLREAERAVGPITLYHVVVTESAHRATAYPASADAIEHEALRTLWETTSPLPGGALVAGKRPGVAAGSRGMVINAPFDALADAVGGSS